MIGGNLIVLLAALFAEPAGMPRSAPVPHTMVPGAVPECRPRTPRPSSDAPKPKASVASPEDARCPPIVVRCETASTPDRKIGGGSGGAGTFTDTLGATPGGATLAPTFPTSAPAAPPPLTPVPTPPSPTAVAPPAAPPTQLAITRLYVDNRPVDGSRAELALGETLETEVDGVSRLLKASLEKNVPIGLFLDGEFLKGVPGYNPPGTSLVSFALNRTSENKGVWSQALGRPGISAREARLAVGFEDRSMVTTRGSWTLRVSLFHTWINFLLFIPIAMIVFGAFYLGRGTALLRDFSPHHPQNVLPPFSLGKTQMAAWFANIAVAYLFIWAATSTLDALNASLLILMGIGSATAFGATFLERRKDTDGGGEKGTVPPPPATSRGFVADLLSDEGGYSLPRLQIVGWTCILILVFWAGVFRDLAMPDFSESVLALMGVSSGTYLGFKIQGRKTSSSVVPPLAPPPGAPPASGTAGTAPPLVA